MSASSERESQAHESQAEYRVSLDTANIGVRGWYRAKFISPDRRLLKISFAAIAADGQPIYAFESAVTGEQFAGYVHVGPQVASLCVTLELSAGALAGMTATLRSIPLIEFIWHSLQSGLLRRPIAFLRYFYRPLDPFVFALSFPSPLRPTGRDHDFDRWIEEEENKARERVMRAMAVRADECPEISILLTVCDPQPVYLRKAIDSVLAQTSPRWQLCIADDASSNPEVRQLLDSTARSDQRISLRLREQRGGISAATNTALAQVQSPFSTCLDHDDMLAPFAIETVGAHLRQRPQTRLIYSDEDKIDQNDGRFSPYFKPDFCPELFYSGNYLNHMSTYHTETVRRIGGWRSEFDGAQDYDLNLRMFGVSGDSAILHIPLILYHWRAIAGSAALDLGYKPYASEAGRRALIEQISSRPVRAQVDIVLGTLYRIRYALPTPHPSVSIIVRWSRDIELLQSWIRSLRDSTTYDAYDIIVALGNSADLDRRVMPEHGGTIDDVSFVRHDEEASESEIDNMAAERSRADYLCFLGDGIEIITPEWLDDMIGYGMQPGVGCVGAKLHHRNGTIRHAGIVLGVRGLASHAFADRGRDDTGYFGRLRAASNYSAVTGACLLVRRSIFIDAGGFDARLSAMSRDVDFCLKVMLLGYRNVVTPFARMFHLKVSNPHDDGTAESRRRIDRERSILVSRYGDLLENDRCYSPNLTRSKNDFSIRVGTEGDRI
jgi:O-antigen biosynthesis protein